MTHIHDAIRALNPSVISIRGDIAYDVNEQEIIYDKLAAEAKLVELQAEQTAKEEAKVAAKESALSKLTALGLTADEVKALLGIA